MKQQKNESFFFVRFSQKRGERKLSDIKSSHNGSSKEIKSINNFNKKATNSYAKKTTCNQDQLSRERRKEIFCTIEYYSFFSLRSSFVLRKRISFHDSLKRGIKKIKYLSLCEDKFHGEAAEVRYFSLGSIRIR